MASTQLQPFKHWFLTPHPHPFLLTQATHLTRIQSGLKCRHNCKRLNSCATTWTSLSFTCSTLMWSQVLLDHVPGMQTSAPPKPCKIMNKPGNEPPFPLPTSAPKGEDGYTGAAWLRFPVAVGVGDRMMMHFCSKQCARSLLEVLQEE